MEPFRREILLCLIIIESAPRLLGNKLGLTESRHDRQKVISGQPIVNPAHLEIEEYEVVNLPCNAYNVTGIVKWYAWQDAAGKTMHNSTLPIWTFTLDDTRTLNYTCLVGNEWSRSERSNVVSVEVIPKDDPFVEIPISGQPFVDPADATVTIYTPLSLTCNDRNINGTLLWYAWLDAAGKTVHNSSKSTWERIVDLNGTLRYTCFVGNRLGVSEQSNVVVVKVTPVDYGIDVGDNSTSTDVPISGRPFINPPLMTVKNNANVMVTCDVSNMNGTMRWYAWQDTTGITVHNWSLAWWFFHVEDDKAHLEYTCSVGNSRGHSEQSNAVTIQVVPAKLRDPSDEIIYKHLSAISAGHQTKPGGPGKYVAYGGAGVLMVIIIISIYGYIKYRRQKVRPAGKMGDYRPILAKTGSDNALDTSADVELSCDVTASSQREDADDDANVAEAEEEV